MKNNGRYLLNFHFKLHNYFISTILIADNNFAAVTLAQIMDTQNTPDELSMVHDVPNEELCPNEYSTTQKSPEMHDNENSLTDEKSNESPEDFRRTTKIYVSGAFKWPHDPN